MNAFGKHDMQHGRIRYSLYDTEQQVELSMDNPMIVSADQAPKLQFLLLNGEICYNHWKPELQAFETVNHPLTGNIIQMDEPIIITINNQPTIQFVVIDGDIYYNHWDSEAGAFETVNHPLTSHDSTPGTYQQEYLTANSTQTLVLNQDIGAFTLESSHGSSIQMIGNSVFRFQPGTYQITLAAGIDFLNANGNLHIVAMNHATHTSLKTPALRVQLEVSPSVNVDDMGQALSSFIHTFETQTDVCLRPTFLAHMNGNSNVYTTFTAQRLK